MNKNKSNATSKLQLEDLISIKDPSTQNGVSRNRLKGVPYNLSNQSLNDKKKFSESGNSIYLLRKGSNVDGVQLFSPLENLEIIRNSKSSIRLSKSVLNKVNS